ncbi:hypothetical protein K469DRAFT_698132 [Zopfia rhizophila CBS 207.26]|uniref:Uncharacterized protein n=1 Tax=Zopfia rhizophila CBS 207.26 TaxID=1314779 RepID=A0A6A6DCL1_9PEZI|nr:hypothetical protein K469DRAFT_698132 [Zopfia rhizophila CBS 207.26]
MAGSRGDTTWGDERARTETIEAAVKEVTGVQTTKDKSDLSKSKHQDQKVKATRSHGIIISYKKCLMSNSDQGSTEARAIEAPENPKISDNKTSDSAAQSGNSKVKNKDRKDINIGKDAHGSKSMAPDKPTTKPAITRTYTS